MLCLITIHFLIASFLFFLFFSNKHDTYIVFLIFIKLIDFVFIYSILLYQAGRSWELFDIRDEIEMTKNSVERLDSQMTVLTQDVATLSQEVRTTLALLQQVCERGGALPPQTTQSCEFLPVRQNPTNPFLSRRSSSQPLRPSSDMQESEDDGPKHAPSTTHSETQTDWYLLDDILSRRMDPGSPPPNSGYSSCSSNEDRVRFLIGHPSIPREDVDYGLDDPASLKSIKDPPSHGTTHYVRTARFWSSADSETSSSVPSSRFRNSINGSSSRESNARSDVPEHIVDIDGSTSIRRKLSTEL